MFAEDPTYSEEVNEWESGLISGITQLKLTEDPRPCSEAVSMEIHSHSKLIALVLGKATAGYRA
jgi:hypothetical protein